MKIEHALIVILSTVMSGCGKKPSSSSLSPTTGIDFRSSSNNAMTTLSYWNGLNSLPGQIASDMSGGPQSQIKALRGAASIIRGNPTLGVDPDLIAWALRMATALELRANLIESSSNPALLAEAFLRGTQGDPLGVAIEFNQIERAWLTSFQALTREQSQLRARLTARYSTEFPPP
ncbi:hypothetical protein BH11PLA2_BH11PLA2_48630 [soil metagenome]